VVRDLVGKVVGGGDRVGARRGGMSSGGSILMEVLSVS